MQRLFFLFLFISSFAQAQIVPQGFFIGKARAVEQGLKLVATDNIGNAYQGNSVAISGDGNTAIIGGWGDNSYAGAAWIWTRSNGLWTKKLKLSPSGITGNYGSQGSAVAITQDGNMVMVGSPGDDGGKGGVWIWNLVNNVWTQSAILKVTSPTSLQYGLGTSIALSSDGTTMVVGGTSYNSSSGAAWVFVRSGNNWVQQGTVLDGNDHTPGSNQGESVAISADGNTILVGGYYDQGRMGAAWIYARSGTTWSQQGSKLVGTGSVGTTIDQGYRVALSPDGNTAFVGGINDNSSAGAVWVYTRSGNSWTQLGNKLIGSTISAVRPELGYSLTISPDGNTFYVGAPGDDAMKGSIRVFNKSANTWVEQANSLKGINRIGIAIQGKSVAISGDGKTLITGGWYDNTGIGAAWVFDL
jgi:hypothetical protein